MSLQVLLVRSALNRVEAVEFFAIATRSGRIPRADCSALATCKQSCYARLVTAWSLAARAPAVAPSRSTSPACSSLLRVMLRS